MQSILDSRAAFRASSLADTVTNSPHSSNGHEPDPFGVAFGFQTGMQSAWARFTGIQIGFTTIDDAGSGEFGAWIICPLQLLVPGFCWHRLFSSPALQIPSAVSASNTSGL
jgi:hypothetical protein